KLPPSLIPLDDALRAVAADPGRAVLTSDQLAEFRKRFWPDEPSQSRVFYDLNPVAAAGKTAELHATAETARRDAKWWVGAGVSLASLTAVLDAHLAGSILLALISAGALGRGASQYGNFFAAHREERRFAPHSGARAKSGRRQQS
ncbi:MAG: hypothetical protein ACRDPW_08405, partial [Mycobacteriales bacterium]